MASLNVILPHPESENALHSILFLFPQSFKPKEISASDSTVWTTNESKVVHLESDNVVIYSRSFTNIRPEDLDCGRIIFSPTARHFATLKKEIQTMGYTVLTSFEKRPEPSVVYLKHISSWMKSHLIMDYADFQTFVPGKKRSPPPVLPEESESEDDVEDESIAGSELDVNERTNAIMLKKESIPVMTLKEHFESIEGVESVTIVPDECGHGPSLRDDFEQLIVELKNEHGDMMVMWKILCEMLKRGLYYDVKTMANDLTLRPKLHDQVVLDHIYTHVDPIEKKRFMLKIVDMMSESNLDCSFSILLSCMFH